MPTGVGDHLLGAQGAGVHEFPIYHILHGMQVLDPKTLCEIYTIQVLGLFKKPSMVVEQAPTPVPSFIASKNILFEHVAPLLKQI